MIVLYCVISCRKRQTRGALVTGVQTCALPICRPASARPNPIVAGAAFRPPLPLRVVGPERQSAVVYTRDARSLYIQFGKQSDGTTRQGGSMNVENGRRRAREGAGARAGAGRHCGAGGRKQLGWRVPQLVYRASTGRVDGRREGRGRAGWVSEQQEEG